MKKWNEIVLEGKGYIGMKVSNGDAIRIYNELMKYGVEIDYSNLHTTIIYDKSNPNFLYTPEIKKYIGYPIDIKMMGKPESDYYSIALMIVSDQLQQKHEELKEIGFQHSYPEFVPHVSLIYRPMDRDIEIIMNNKKQIIENIRRISFDSEWIEELHS